MNNFFDSNKLSWALDEKDQMLICVKYNGQAVMKISLYEAIESSGYNNIMKHVRECNRTPWLRRWQEERMQDVYSTLKSSPK